MSEQLIAAAIGVVVGGILAWLKAALAIREKVNEDLRDRRLATYPIVYQLTAPLSRWPPAEMTYQELLELNLALRQWYFTGGGLYLSANGREQYGEMKQLICAYLAQPIEEEDDDGTRSVPAHVYKDLEATASVFRNALTEDLETRRQRSVWWVVRRRQQHRKEHEKWLVLINKVGGPDREVEPYPLKEMPLPPVRPDARHPDEDPCDDTSRILTGEGNELTTTLRSPTNGEIARHP